MRLGFENIIFEMPSRKTRVDILARKAGFGKDMIAKLHENGLWRVPVNDKRPLNELINKATKRLIKEIPDLPKRTKGIIVAHSLPILSPADVPFLNLCFKNCGLDEVPRIAVTGQPCSILHMGVQLGSAWLGKEPGDSGILVIGADKAYSPEERIFFGSAMGDVAVVGFLTNNAKGNFILSSISECEIIAYEGELSPPDDIAKFRSLNPSYVRHGIETALSKGNLKLTDLRYIIPHTPNNLIWDAIANLIKFPRDRVLTDYITETGHLNSNDSFCHYVRACNEKRVEKGDFVLLVNQGFGGTRGCTLIQR